MATEKGNHIIRLRLETNSKQKRTGFEDKTLWDQLQLLLQLISALAIPIAIPIATTWFSNQQTQTSMQIAEDQQEETTLENYFDHISTLLFNDNLHSSRRGDESRAVARGWTLIALRQLNGKRKGELIRFLFEADLIGINNKTYTINNADNPIIDLGFADLSDSDLSGIFLGAADLHNTILNKADLSHSYLNHSNLSICIMIDANFTDTRLVGADLLNSDLAGVNLSGANLLGAQVTKGQLAQASSLKGATMPDGSKHP